MKIITNKYAFSLVELMVVIAIVAITAAVGVPAYQEYATKAKSLEKLSFAGDVPFTTQQYYNTHGAFPTDATAYGLPASAAPFTVKNYLMYYGVSTLPKAPGQCESVNFFEYLTDYDGHGRAGDIDGAYVLLIYNYSFNVNDTIINKCFYTEYKDPSGEPTGRKILPGCNTIEEETAIVADIMAQCP